MARDATRMGTRTIGLIGGLALRAGILYYDQVARRIAARGSRLSLVLHHADLDTVLAFVAAGDKAGLGTYLGTLANELSDAGAEVVAVTAVAPHLAIREIEAIARVPGKRQPRTTISMVLIELGRSLDCDSAFVRFLDPVAGIQ